MHTQLTKRNIKPHLMLLYISYYNIASCENSSRTDIENFIHPLIKKSLFRKSEQGLFGADDRI